MSEIEKQTDTSESVSSGTTAEVVKEEAKTTKKKSPVTAYTIAIVIVAVILLGVLYKLEKEGRSQTGLFDAIITKQLENTVVAEVNDSEITNADLATSMQQFGQAATAQGVDITDPQVQTDIRTQALEVLINTELLLQAAEAQGIKVTDEEVEERLSAIEADMGGAEQLATRMEELGITSEQLDHDIRDEIIIQQLIDKKFAEADFTVSEEEILATYEQVGGEEAGLPPLEEVREQVVAQITNSKEQAVVDAYITELKESADIDIKEE